MRGRGTARQRGVRFPRVAERIAGLASVAGAAAATQVNTAPLGNMVINHTRVGLIVRSHHERWDGGGYPDDLSGTRQPR